MACLGNCQVQLFDVDISDVKVETVLFDPKDGKSYPAPAGHCPDLTADEKADALQPPFTKIEGCKDDACVCAPTDPNPQWTDWLTYNADAEITKPDSVNPKAGYVCKYKLTGTYSVSSAVVNGVCVKKPAVPLPRPKSTKPKKAKVGEGSKTVGVKIRESKKKPKRQR